MFGKDTKKKELINNLDQVITICAETEFLSVVAWSQQHVIYFRQLFLTAAKSCRSENDNIGQFPRASSQCKEDIIK